MDRACRIALVALGLALTLPARADQTETAPPTQEQLAAMERVRPLVNAIWQDVRTPAKPDEEHPRYFWEITDQLIALGPDVVPFLTSELDLVDPNTFHFSAYALGQLGGADAEAALRKAVRIADLRGGRFGLACKRFALFGLALMGKADALDLMQGGQTLHGALMIPDYPFAAHLGLLTGRDAVPLLLKQLDTYRSDPKAAEKLEDAVLALGRAGDASVAPKLVSLLAHGAPGVRAAAADAVSRLGAPALCESLLPLLSAKDQSERLQVAAALARWAPEPCYKAMVGRLETEDDVAVRASLYTAVAAIGGEASLEVFRAFVKSPNQFDQALVVDSIGRIGSRKGLNLLRAILPDANANTAAHALEAIASIGGEGAIDTIFAATSDRRRSVASGAAEILTRLGDDRVAPRRAGELLELVREPVGNLSARARIVEMAEALVTLRYTEPIDDLTAALKVQTDPEIVETLTSCLRRLSIIKKDGKDDAAWASEMSSPFASVRALAAERLAESDTPAAVRTLGTRLARTDLDPGERATIFIAIGKARTVGAAALIERNLSDPTFDAWELRDARAAAAWAARRLGDDQMTHALRVSAVRRDGRDWAVLVYLAVLEKSAAMDTLKVLRVRRMRYPDPTFGHEAGLLDDIIAILAAGRAPTRFDATPEALFEM